MRPFLALALIALASPVAHAAQNRAFALTSDFVTGSLSVVDLDTRNVTKDVASVGPDAVPRFYDGLLYVVNRYGGDNIQVIDPAHNYATIRQFSVGNGSNPQDIAFVSPTKAYVSRYGSADLLIVNPSDPAGLPTKTISLAAFADADGLPEMARMALLGPYLFVACQRLTNFQPVNESVIVVVNAEADTVVDIDPATPGPQAIPLQSRNPVTALAIQPASPQGSQLLYLGTVGVYGDLDGLVEGIDPVALHGASRIVSEADLGGDIAVVGWSSPTRGFAVAGDFNAQRLVAWDAETRAVTDTLFTANGGFSLPDAGLDDRGELWACKNPFPASSGDAPGLLVFDAAAGALLAGPLDTGLPPLAVTFGEVAGPPPVPGGLALSAPWPNPAATFTRMSFDLAQAARASAEIFDLGGRQVRGIDLGPQSAGRHSVAWDLADDDGRLVPAGLYVLQVRVGGKRASRRITVVR